MWARVNNCTIHKYTDKVLQCSKCHISLIKHHGYYCYQHPSQGKHGLFFLQKHTPNFAIRFLNITWFLLWESFTLQSNNTKKNTTVSCLNHHFKMHLIILVTLDFIEYSMHDTPFVKYRVCFCDFQFLIGMKRETKSKNKNEIICND